MAVRLMFDMPRMHHASPPKSDGIHVSYPATLMISGMDIRWMEIRNYLIIWVDLAI